MLKVHVVDSTNRHRYQDALEQHHRLRHQIYVGERRWLALARPDEREVDQFDTPAATYLLALDPAGTVVAGSRLVPTLAPHLMSEVFPQLAAARGLPRAPDIYEWTRIFVAPAWRECGRPCRAAGYIYAGLLEFALSRAIRQLSIVCETYWISRLAELHWRPRSLGEPIVVDGMTVVGITVDMTEQALLRTRHRYGLRAAVIEAETAPSPASPAWPATRAVA